LGRVIMGKIDLKDKRNVYAIIVCLLIMAAAHLVYNYVWDPFTYQRESLERDLQSAQAELDKIKEEQDEESYDTDYPTNRTVVIEDEQQLLEEQAAAVKPGTGN
jgi:cell division protein FtsB